MQSMKTKGSIRRERGIRTNAKSVETFFPVVNIHCEIHVGMFLIMDISTTVFTKVGAIISTYI